MPPEVLEQLSRQGYATLPATAESLAWARAAHRVGKTVLADPDQRAKWLRHGGTWFVGVDALPTDGQGAIDGVPLPWADWLCEVSGQERLHRAQLSVTFPGYPMQDPSESDGAFAYRRNRGAAHVDGLHKLPEGGRILAEPHAIICGIGLNEAPQGASCLLVWPESHRKIGLALKEALPKDPADWPGVDISGPYMAARRAVFANTKPLPLATRPGETVLLHRHMLHGIQSWMAGPGLGLEGRMVAYFRPEFRDSSRWFP